MNTNVLIIGKDSGIGNAIFSQYPNAHCTSRKKDQNINTYYLELMDKDTWPIFRDTYDMVYYCIGVVTDNFEFTMKINAILSYEFLYYVSSYVNAGGTIRILSSRSGSNSFNAETVLNKSVNKSSVSYKMSKAALNSGVIQLLGHFPNINYQLVDPGLVNTNMTINYRNDLIKMNPVDAAKKIVNLPIIEGLSFIHSDGTMIPW